MFRFLRITFSAGCGILCLLFVALCVRSYWWHDWVTFGTQNVASIEGKLHVNDVYNIQSRNGALVAESFDFGFVRGMTMSGGVLIPVGVGTSYPLWPSVAIAAALAAIPWTPRRFSLRTLLIAMTVIAVGLGIIAVWY